MEKIKVSAVKYANTYPFIWGLTESGFTGRITLETDHPAECAAKLIAGKADIGLIPVAALPLMKEYNIISDFCIGANGKVRTVMLLSNCEFKSIRIINLDYRSRSSVNLTKVLAKNMWKREFKWMNTSELFNFETIGDDEAVVLIGDQCFEFENNFKFKTDLAEEWKNYTGLPFVFACWVSNRGLEDEFVRDFNLALKYGVENIGEVAKKYGKTGSLNEADLKDYLTNNIDYIFDDGKKKGMKLFLNLLKDI